MICDRLKITIYRNSDRLQVVDADGIQMRQILQNLIGNALKFRQEDVAPLVQVRSRIVNLPKATQLQSQQQTRVNVTVMQDVPSAEKAWIMARVGFSSYDLNRTDVNLS